MVLKTYHFNGGQPLGSIVIDDEAPTEELAAAMLLDAYEEHGNGRPIRKSKEEKNG